jgi:prefoldin subunit 5
VNDLAQKVAQLMKMASENRTVGASRELLDEVWAMRDKNTILAQELAGLQTENDNLKKDFTELKTAMQDLSRLVASGSVASAGSTPAASAQVDEGSSSAKLTSLENDLQQLTQSVQQMTQDKAAVKDLKQLQDTVSKMSVDVFRAKSNAYANKLSISSLENFKTKMCEYSFTGIIILYHFVQFVCIT